MKTFTFALALLGCAGCQMAPVIKNSAYKAQIRPEGAPEQSIDIDGYVHRTIDYELRVVCYTHFTTGGIWCHEIHGPQE